MVHKYIIRKTRLSILLFKFCVKMKKEKVIHLRNNKAKIKMIVFKGSKI